MSDSDSFITEVTEEVRREKLYGYLRRYGWIAVVAVVLLVGGAAFNEYRNAQARDQARATGDALMAALAEADPVTRAAQMATVEGPGDAAAVTLLLQAATQQEADQTDAAADSLSAVVNNPDLPTLYRDIATLKLAMLPTGDMDTRRASLAALSQPGQPFRLLALEQLAYLQLAEGNRDAAITTATQVMEDAGVTRSLRDRMQTLMLSLGEEPPTPPAANPATDP